MQPHDKLWAWMLKFQLPAPLDPKQNMWVGFFEDMIDFDQIDRNSWAPLEVARYLIERKETLDPQWQHHTLQLMQFALSLFSQQRPGNVTVMGEQDYDHKPWGGANSHLGAVATMFACAGGPSYFKQMGINNLNWMTYFVRQDGCPQALSDGVATSCGGWQQDASTDVIHNYMDALNALKKGIC